MYSQIQNPSPYPPATGFIGVYFRIKEDDSEFESIYLRLKAGRINTLVSFNPESNYSITNEWKSYSISLSELDQGANLADVTALVFFRGDKDFDGKDIYIKNIFYSPE